MMLRPRTTLKAGSGFPDNEQAMSSLQLMQMLARSAAAMSDPAEVQRLLHTVPADAGLDCELRLSADGVLQVTWHSPPEPEQSAFIEALAACVALAGLASTRAGSSLLDARAFSAELNRVTGAARWRDHEAAVAVFDVDGLAHGPGVDESEMVAHVGALARSAVRSDDIVAHLGAGRFALLLPRAGSFEARSAYRRVRDAVAASEFAPDHGVSCSRAGFAELNDAGGDDMLMVAIQRLTDSARRTAYEGPFDPLHPLAG